jgi:hypothetical protein
VPQEAKDISGANQVIDSKCRYRSRRFFEGSRVTEAPRDYTLNCLVFSLENGRVPDFIMVEVLAKIATLLD